MAHPGQGAGCLFVGEGIVAGGSMACWLSRPLSSADGVILRADANQSRALGLFRDIVNGVAVDVALGAATLKQDLITIDVQPWSAHSTIR
jgi:hypothetical protein